MDHEEHALRVIGVSISVPEPWSGLLHDLRIRVGDTAAESVRPHLTLLGPTEVPVGDERIGRHLAAVAAHTAPFTLWLRGTGTFRPVTPVVYVAVAGGGAQCERLAARIRSGPLRCEQRFPYHPHVTVAQEVSPEALDLAYTEMSRFSARFRVEKFASHVREPDGRWHIEREFPLTGSPAPAPRGHRSTLRART